VVDSLKVLDPKRPIREADFTPSIFPLDRMPHSRNCCAGPRPVAAVLLSNLYLIYVLDLWFEWWSSPRLRG
jgi:hypothetical protein